MSYRVVLSRAAIEELDDARLWFSQQGVGRIAVRKYAAILRGIKNLETNPEMYAIDPDAIGHRAIPISGYWVRFVISGSDVFVTRIFGRRRHRD
jgi:plasmid stabilization system protein ParE